MRRRILVASVVAALLLAACGNSASSKPASPDCPAQDFLRKPFNIERLMAAIGRAIPANGRVCN